VDLSGTTKCDPIRNNIKYVFDHTESSSKGGTLVRQSGLRSAGFNPSVLLSNSVSEFQELFGCFGSVFSSQFYLSFVQSFSYFSTSLEKLEVNIT